MDNDKKVIIKLEDVSKSFNEKNVVKKINLDIYDGEFLTILGPSGCGKTTILRMISGLEKVSFGKVYIDNKDVTMVDASKRMVNTIFQNFALFNHMTVYDNVAYGLKMKRVSKDEIKKQVKKMLELVKLSGYEDRYPLELSGGEKQRVAIARGLANNPKVLLLDEPLSSLDLKLKKEMQIELKRLQKKLKITFVYVTHNQEEALSMSDRIMIFNNGILQQLGSPMDIYNNPKNKFVADFIGESNIFKGIIKKIDNEYAYISIFDNLIKFKNNNYLVDDEIYIMIRPENIRINNKNDCNKLETHVKEIIYSGNISRLIVNFLDEEIKVNVNSFINLQESDKIIITFNEDDICSFRR